jgi:hypothetical protein
MTLPTPPLPGIGSTTGDDAAARGVRARVDDLFGHPVVGVPLRTGLLMAAAFVMEVLLLRITRLPDTAYARPVLVDGLLGRIAGAGAAGLLVGAAFVGAVGVAILKRSPGPGWTDFEHGPRVRLLVTLQAAILAWVYALQDYNFLFDQGWPVDRLLVVAAVALVAFRPAFILPFLVLLLPLVWQLTWPIGGFSWAVPILPVRVLILCAAMWILRMVTSRVRTVDWIFVVCCTIAANYWASGVEKLRLGWLVTDRIGYLVPSTYANGWLGFLRVETADAITRAMLALNTPAKAATLLVECGAILILWRRAGARTVLFAVTGLHIAVFLLTGIGFWQWAVLNLLVVALFLSGDARVPELFTRSRFALSLVLIAGATLWFRPVRLAWMDARATYTYRLEATTAGGRTVPLTPAFFTPYDYPFTLSGFRYLVDAPRLPLTWGATTPSVALRLNDARTADAVLALETEVGHNDFDAARAAAFEDFVRRFVTSWERRDGRRGWYAPFSAPATLWTFPRADPDLEGDVIERATVHEVLSFFDDERYVEIRRIPVLVVQMQP